MATCLVGVCGCGSRSASSASPELHPEPLFFAEGAAASLEGVIAALHAIADAFGRAAG
jgi:hypothetical protein